MKQLVKALFCYLFHAKVMMPVTEQRFGSYVLTRSLSACPRCETVRDGRIVPLKTQKTPHKAGVAEGIPS